ncbi:MAG: glycosyl transferase [Bacilli bacterium]|nr:glycosyl transferase [Bacilli bacterium]
MTKETHMLLNVNQMIFIEKLDEEYIIYKTRVADIHTKYFSVEVPIDIKTGSFKPLKEGEKVAVSYTREDGIQFQFFSTIIGSSIGNIRTFHLEKPEPKSIKKIQRREYLRIPVNVNLSIEHKGTILQATSKDLSGGGVSIVDEERRFTELDEVTGVVMLEFKNGKQERVPFRGTIARIILLHNDVKAAVIEFTEIYEAQRAAIVRFSFERQLEIRYKTSSC